MLENTWANIKANMSSAVPGIISAVATLVAIFYPDATAFINQVAAAVAVLFGAIFALLTKSASMTGTAANPRAQNHGDVDPGPVVPKV